MRRTSFLVSVLVLVIAGSGAVLAEEIVHLTNGTTMAIRSHTIKDGMIHVDLGSNALMAFPAYMVEKIEKAGKDVYVGPSYQRANIAASRIGGGGNVQVSTGSTRGGAAYPMTGRSSVPSKYRGGGGGKRVERYGRATAGWAASSGPGKHGLQTTRPAAGSKNSRARQFGAVGRQGAWMVPAHGSTPGNLEGSGRVGDKYVIQTRSSSTGAGRPPGLEIKAVTMKGKAPPPPSEQSSDGGSSGSGN